MIDEVLRLDLMREAIAEAKKSRPEADHVPHVGAILTDSSGEILHRAHRGERGSGDHAEFILLSRAEEAGTDLADTVLFVTLEPCTRRGLEKTPCAIRIAQKGIRRIFIGTLDPNPHITGHGEMFLSEHMEVEYFPWRLRQELKALSAGFFDRHQHAHIPAVSVYASSGSKYAEVPTATLKLSGQREGLLLQSTDLMAGTSGEICILAGRMSWLKEVLPVLLLAHLRGRRVRVALMVGGQPCHEVKRTAAILHSLGAEIGMTKRSLSTRATLLSPDSNTATMVVIERTPALHGSLFRYPHDQGILDAFGALFEEVWAGAQIEEPGECCIRPVSEAQVIDALRQGVPQYQKAQFEFTMVAPERVLPLPKSLERLKLFRLTQFTVLEARFKVTAPCVVVGCPWPIAPPVVEVLADGRMVVIDGAHRFFLASSRADSAVSAFVVRGAAGDLPATPRAGWDDVLVATAKLLRADRYEDYRPELFRPIRDALGTLALPG